MTGRDDAGAEVDASIARLFHWAAYADKWGGEVQETTLYGVTTKVHEPKGVIAILCPDESPLLSFVSLLAPAVVRSNAVVIVPSEKFPLCAVDLYQVFEAKAAGNLKRTWVDYGVPRDWRQHGAGDEFLYQATEVKNIWHPI